MSVEATVSTNSNLVQAFNISPSPIGRLSDGSLVVVSQVSFNFEVRRSTDGGSSWSLDFTTTSFLTNAFYGCLIQNDSIYILGSDYVLAHRFKRVDFVSGSFVLGVDTTTVFTDLPAGSSVGFGCFARENGGRLWCARGARDNSDALQKLHVIYSDDNGVSWSSQTLLDTNATYTITPFLLTLEKNLICAYINGGNLYTRDRLHTDTPTSWTSGVSRFSTEAGTRNVHGAALSITLPKKAFMIVNDSISTGNMKGMNITETGSSLAYSSIGTVSISFSNSVVSGRTDGWRISTLRNVDGTHIRTHLVADSATSWPSSSDVSISNAFNNNDIVTIPTLPSPKDDGSDFTVWFHVTNHDIFSRTDTLPRTLNTTRVIPISWRFLPGFFRSLPVSWTGLFTASRNIPIAWLSGYVFFYRSIPASWLGRMAIKRVVPLTWHGPIPFGMTRSVPIAWSALKVFQRQLPVNWSVVVVADWLVITSPEGDGWAVLPISPESDAWTPLSPPSGDTWS